MKPSRVERLGIGLMEDKYTFHKYLWIWSVDSDGYLVVEKRKNNKK